MDNNQRKLISNYLYNLIYQFLLIFLPLATLPYLSRILGADGIGTYSYVVAITSYFILIGTLGLNLYGQKEIAYVQDDEIKRSKKFFEIFLLKFITLSISLLVFILVFSIRGEYSVYYRILIIEIIGNIFDITWFFQGMEEFKKTVVRNCLVKIISTALIFILIKTKADLHLYFWIYALSIFLGNLSVWFYLSKYIKKIKISFYDMLRHLKPAIILLIPQVATQIYTVLDKSMIGNLASSIQEVGYYDNAQKIIKVGITLVTAMGTVMLPRISNFFAKEKNKEINDYLNKSFSLVFLISFPLILGMIVTVDSFVPIFFGNGFEKVASLIKCISPVIFIIGMSNILGIQYLLPTKNNKPYIIAVVSGAVINVILNFILIRKYDSIGASVSTLCAEGVVFLVEFIYLFKKFDFKIIFKNIFKYLLSSIIMFILCYFIGNITNVNTIMKILLQVCVGGITYIMCLAIMHEDYLTMILNKIIKKGNNYEKK